jgi:hypothetical protein
MSGEALDAHRGRINGAKPRWQGDGFDGGHLNEFRVTSRDVRPPRRKRSLNSRVRWLLFSASR